MIIEVEDTRADVINMMACLLEFREVKDVTLEVQKLRRESNDKHKV